MSCAHGIASKQIKFSRWRKEERNALEFFYFLLPCRVVQAFAEILLLTMIFADWNDSIRLMTSIEVRMNKPVYWWGLVERVDSSWIIQPTVIIRSWKRTSSGTPFDRAVSCKNISWYFEDLTQKLMVANNESTVTFSVGSSQISFVTASPRRARLSVTRTLWTEKQNDQDHMLIISHFVKRHQTTISLLNILIATYTRNWSWEYF